MRLISKGNEPPSLTQHRKGPHADYANYADKQALRESLANEQRGLCCYCLSRIRPDPSRMKVEHWHSQAHYSAEQLDYGNLLGACMGNEGQISRRQHCDTKKGSRDLSRNPSNPMHHVEEGLHFRPDGRVLSDDPAFDCEINDVLNLNEAFLKRNREATLDAFLQALAKRGTLSQSTLEKWLREWNGEASSGELKPFNQVIVYWLRKRIARA
jgi:uncharacterized protein (TIGR02646 family)